MPVAVSKMVATRIAREEHQNSRSRILRAALVYATVIGGVAAAVLWFGAETFAQLIKTPFSMYALKTLAPTIWIMAYLGVLQGIFPGHRFHGSHGDFPDSGTNCKRHCQRWRCGPAV